MTLFIHCYSKGHEGLQVTALQIICDMVTTHPSLLAPVTQSDGETVTPSAIQKPLLKVFSRALKANSPPSVQSGAASALSKLLLTSTFEPTGPNVPPAIQEHNQNAVETLLQSLVVSFFHPRTKGNPALRQSLAYFFPVYCHSRLENTQHMRRVAVPVVRGVMNAAEEHYSLEAEEDSDGEIDESIGEREIKTLMTGVIGMLAEWTDERRVVGLGGERILAGGAASSNACGWVHLALVKDILERVLGVSAGSHRCNKEERKLLFSMLSKLFIAAPTVPSHAGSRAPEGEDQFRSSIRSATVTGVEIEPDNVQLAEQVKELLDETIEEGLAAEASSRNALVKAKNSVLKILAVAQDARAASARPRAGTEDSDTRSVRSASIRRSVEPNLGRRGVSVEPSIMEEDEGDSGIRSGSVRPTVEGGAARSHIAVEPSIMEEDEEDDHDTSRGTIIKDEMADE